jgi:hypothetical protein
MNRTQNKLGKCALCGIHGKLSFEHVPPRSAFNNGPIFIKTFDNIFNQNSHLFGKSIRSNRGFGSFTLCENCNKTTGSWYAKDFAEFTRQGMEIVKKHEKGTYFIIGTYQIKPLNTLKQILTMFMAADQSGILLSQKSLTEFILNKEDTNLPDRYRIYLYSTLSRLKRMIGYSCIKDLNMPVMKWSEINFQPFGYFLTDESDSSHKDMFDLSCFCKYCYNQVCTIQIKTPYLPVNDLMIGSYH